MEGGTNLLQIDGMACSGFSRLRIRFASHMHTLPANADMAIGRGTCIEFTRPVIENGDFYALLSTKYISISPLPLASIFPRCVQENLSFTIS